MDHPLQVIITVVLAVLTVLVTLAIRSPNGFRRSQKLLAFICVIIAVGISAFLELSEGEADETYGLALAVLISSIIIFPTTFIVLPALTFLRIVAPIAKNEAGGISNASDQITDNERLDKGKAQLTKADLDQSLVGDQEGQEKNHIPSVLIIGDGYSGKSQLIRSLTGSFLPIPPGERTMAPLSVRTTGPSGSMDLHDFRGQSFDQVTQLIEENSLADGRINAVIFVIAVVCPPDESGLTREQYDSILHSEISKKFLGPSEDCILDQTARIGGGFFWIFSLKN